VAVLAAPRFTAAGLVPQSESHELTARSTIDGVTNNQVIPGTTSSPVSPVDVTAIAPGALARLYLTFDGQSMTVDLVATSSTATLPDSVSVGDISAVGSFGITFSVAEATPFTLSAELGTLSRFPKDVGRARLSFEEDGVDITSDDTGFIGLPDSLVALGTRGVFLPGRTYTLTGAVDTSLPDAGQRVVEYSESYFSFKLMIPEPTFLALAAPGMMLLLARRRR
jgi:hypothetical protein